MDPLHLSSTSLSAPCPPDVGPFGVGALRALARDPLEFFIQTARRCGDVARFELAGKPVFQLTHPEHNYQVLVERQRAFKKSQRVKRVLGQWSGDGLALIDGEAWARLRRRINPSFGNERITCHVAVVARHARALVERWHGQREVDVSEAVSRLTLRVVAETLFGADVEAHLEDFSRHLAVLNECAVRELGSLLPLPLWAPTPHKRRLRASVRHLDEVVYGMIARCRAQSGERPHLLSALSHTVDEAGHALTDREAHDAIVNLLLGGNETTGTGIVWASSRLAVTPRSRTTSVARSPPSCEAVSRAQPRCDSCRASPRCWRRRCVCILPCTRCRARRWRPST